MQLDEVWIHGAGVVGRWLAAGLVAEGVSVRLFPRRGGRAVPPPGPLVYAPFHPEHPHRFLHALGLPVARELTAFTLEHRARLWGFRPTGLRWRPTASDAEDLPRSRAAARALGLAVEPDGEGLLFAEGGLWEAAPVAEAHTGAAPTAAPAAPEPLTPAAPAAPTAVPAPAAPLTPADEPALSLWTAPPLDAGDLPWLEDKLWPVSWHLLPIAGAARGLPEVSRQAGVWWNGGDLYAGARWAEPHMGVGDHSSLPPSPVVEAALVRLAAQDLGAHPGGPAARLGTWESCDGLPLVGPVPGRPRDIVCTGFGAALATWAPGCVAHVLAEVLGILGPRLPAAFAAGRMR